MIKCPFCNSTYPENTLFCDECGSYLAPGDGQATDPLSGEGSEKSRASKPGSGSFKTLMLSMDDGGSVELPLSKEVFLGRLDPGRAIFPDVDLTSQDGMDKGVSRRHARITLREGHLYYQRDGRNEYRLKPLDRETFALEGYGSFRIRFAADETGRVTKIVGLYIRGNTDESPRDGI